MMFVAGWGNIFSSKAFFISNDFLSGVNLKGVLVNHYTVPREL